jgi:hypothetical protein
LEQFSVEYALLAVQSALLGEVTPALRAVFANVDEDQEIFYFYVYYDKEVSEKTIDLWECACTEASADLGPCFIEREIERLDHPKAIPVRGYCAYLRKGDNELNCLKGTLPQVVMRGPTMGYALVAVQQSLLGTVTPELRSVTVDLEKDPLKLFIRFYHDGEISEELHQCWQSAQKKAQDYFGFDCAMDAEIERVDYPLQMPFRGRYAYVRKKERS